MEATKRYIADTVQKAVDGEADALEIYAQLKDFKDHVDLCLKAVKEEAVIEAEKQGEKSFTHKGFSFQYNEGRRSYDFKHIEEWNAVNDHRKEIERKAKAAANHSGTFVDDDGVVIEPCIVKYSDPILKV